MKKKPSLLDIELFVQKRTDEKEKELSKIEAASDALVFESIVTPSVAVHSPSSPTLPTGKETDTTGSIEYENKVKSEPAPAKNPMAAKNSMATQEPVSAKDSMATQEPVSAKDSLSTKGSLLPKDSLLARHENTDTAVSKEYKNDNNMYSSLESKQIFESHLIEMVDDKLSSIIKTTHVQKDDINRLKLDMFKIKEQLSVYHSFLSNQQKKISDLEKMLLENKTADNAAHSVVDNNYSKLLLKNIVWLKDEKDFSSNDVARLFRAEGFQVIHPYENWDEKVINIFYSKAKKTFL
ncbi:MAG: hypothetical protein HQK67_10105 [Desulfamplus sp.]|nr:hypothetical protein [Desulfamplus sp.]